MTKHRKILDGVSEGPWYRIHDPENLPVLPGVGEFDQLGDADFAVHARNQWPAICDLIEAVEHFKQMSSNEDTTPEHLFEISIAEQLVFKALDKLNEES